MEMQKTRHIVRVRTNAASATCSVCSQTISVGSEEPLTKVIDHYLSAHGYALSLLHIGSEWGTDADGKPASHRVAIYETN